MKKPIRKSRKVTRKAAEDNRVNHGGEPITRVSPGDGTIDVRSLTGRILRRKDGRVK